MITKLYVMMAAITIILITGLVSSSPYAFGVPPQEGFLKSKNCTFGPTQGGKFPATCCWRENGTNYCQTCVFVYTGQGGEGGYEVCNAPDVQMLDIPPNNPPSSPSGPSAPIQDDGVLKQTDKPNKGSVMNLPNSGERTLE